MHESFVTVQINYAISFDHTKKQWAHLGFVREACIVRPNTCGAAGGTLTFWMRLTHANKGYVLSS